MNEDDPAKVENTPENSTPVSDEDLDGSGGLLRIQKVRFTAFSNIIYLQSELAGLELEHALNTERDIREKYHQGPLRKWSLGDPYESPNLEFLPVGA